MTLVAAELSGVWKWYGRHPAVADVYLAVTRAEIVGLIGRNGAGKTTILRLMAGVLRPSRGHVCWPGTLLAARGSIRYFAGERTLPPAVRASTWLRLWKSTATAPARRIALLSRGTRQRLGLEAMLADSSAGLLLFDEPWESLDPDASRWLSEALVARRDAGAAIVVSSHRIHDLGAICSRCIFVVDGRLASEVCINRSNTGDRTADLLAAFDRAG